MKRLAITLLISLAALSFAGCKVTKPMLKMIVSRSNKLSPELYYADSLEHKIGIQYVDKGDPAQVFDVYYADSSRRRDAVLIDIHGGFYVAGRRESNRRFGSVFLKEGYDLVLVEYRLNDGKRDVGDELGDCAAALDYLAGHAAELGLNKDRMFLTGDSAGGHMALYMAEGASDASLPVRPETFRPAGVLVNCPAYNYAEYGKMTFYTDKTLRWFLGPRYKDESWMASMSSRTYIGSYAGPLFASTCTHDFLREDVLLLKADCDSLGREIDFVDIASEDRKVGHVHNVTNLSLPESQTVNARMLEFLDRL